MGLLRCAESSGVRMVELRAVMWHNPTGGVGTDDAPVCLAMLSVQNKEVRRAGGR